MCYYTSEMACPHFEPTQPTRGRGSENAMLPLGDHWAGLCCAGGATPWVPDETTLRSHCNFGYARGACARVPSDDLRDAVRFAISADNGAVVVLSYVVERNHHPFANGILEYSRVQHAFSGPVTTETLHRQAHAYIASYLRQESRSLSPLSSIQE